MSCLQNVINLDCAPYNLVNDGSTDNSAQLQQAVNDAMHTDYGAVLQFGRGEYLFNGLETLAGNYYPGGSTVLKAGCVIKDPFMHEDQSGGADPWGKETHPNNPALTIRGVGNQTRLLMNSDSMVMFWVAAGWIRIENLIIDGQIGVDFTKERCGIWIGPEHTVDNWKYKPYWSDVAYPTLEFVDSTSGNDKIILRSGTNSRWTRLGTVTWSINVSSANESGNDGNYNVLAISTTNYPDDTLEVAAGSLTDDSSDTAARIYGLATVGNYSHNLIENVFVERMNDGWISQGSLRGRSNVHNSNAIDTGNSYWNNSRNFKGKFISGSGFRTIEPNHSVTGETNNCTRGHHERMHFEQINAGIDLEAAETMTFINPMINECNSTYSPAGARYEPSIGIKVHNAGSVSNRTCFRNEFLDVHFEGNEKNIDDAGDTSKYKFTSEIDPDDYTVGRDNWLESERVLRLPGLKDEGLHGSTAGFFLANDDTREPINGTTVRHESSSKLITWDTVKKRWNCGASHGPADSIPNSYGPSSQGLVSYPYACWTDGSTEEEMFDTAPSGWSSLVGTGDSIAIANDRLECDCVTHASFRSASYYYNDYGTAFTEFWLTFFFKINADRTPNHNLRDSANDGDWLSLSGVMDKTAVADAMNFGLSYQDSSGNLIPKVIFREDGPTSSFGSELSFAVMDNVWYQGTLYAKKATTNGGADGIYKAWINNDLIESKTNVDNFNIPWDRVAIGMVDIRQEFTASMDFGDVRFDTSSFSNSRGGL